MLYRANSKLLDQNFLYYSLLGPTLQAQLKTLGAGSTVEHVRVPDAEKLIIPHPIDVAIQRKIAAILSSYDELIENNKRRIVVLEKMAEEIYREWFVRFRFPGYQDAEFDKGIPKGWQFELVGKAFESLGGGTPSKKEEKYWHEGSVNWFTPTDITASNSIYLDESIDKTNEEGVEESSTKMFSPYSIMMTSRATIGAIGINKTAACTNQGFITCIPNDSYPLSYLYHWLKLNKNYFISLCNGATFLELGRTQFKRLEILKPDDEVMKQFNETVSPIFNQLEVLSEQNQNLEKTKQKLLPRLISGKLSVEKLDIQFPPAMLDK